ncbi:hypothetical protein TSMEX_011611 [Taenia solium]|eukprot:TsM_001074300 transcript=TsM_001074300 gene=TsM_001074300
MGSDEHLFFEGETSPKLWGSRVVSKSSGPSDYVGIVVYTATEIAPFTFSNGSCKVRGEYWGNPCQIGEDTANITVKDVNMQKHIKIHTGTIGDLYTLSTFFAPKCKFPPLATGEVVPKTSFPLSRFVKGQQSFQLDFAVKGADSEESVQLRRGSAFLCSWSGVNVSINESDVCVDLEKDKASDLRVFHGAFTPRSDVQWDSFTWSTFKSELAISVDYTQSGE